MRYFRRHLYHFLFTLLFSIIFLIFSANLKSSASDQDVRLGKVGEWNNNYGDDPDKVRHSWRFYVDDEPINVWDWKGSCFMDRWSFYGHPATIAKLFGEDNVEV